MWLQDSGGSTGELRAAFNMPAMGDIRKCMIALAPEDTVLTSACRHRFDNPEGIAGHSLGNLIISALFQMSGGFADASLRAASIQLKGRVLPSTENAMTLCAAYEDGGVARGEANIPKPGGRIRRVWLSPDRPAAAPGVIAARMRPTRSCSGWEFCTPASLRMKQEYTDRLNRRIQSVAFAGQPVDEDPVVEQQDHRRRLRRVIRLLNCGVENRHAVRKVQVKRADSRNKQGVWLRVRRRWSPERRLW